MSELFVYFRKALAGLLLLALAGCSAVYRNHGYVPDDSELENIVVGVSTRESVAEEIGSPTTYGVKRDGRWYYVQSRWRHFAMYEPREIDRQLVAISFDSQGVVQNVERFTLEDGRVVPISRRVTDSNIKGVSFIRQLLGNIGNIRAGDVLGGQ